MGRQHTFMDREFGRAAYDSDDDGTFERGLVLVIMAFGSQGALGVLKTIKEEAAKLDLHATRVDEEGGSGFIIRELTFLIEQAEFIVCDLSDERPNVYYELGYAHGCGNEGDDILLVARTGTQLHFDIAPLRVHYYDNLTSLRRILSSQLDRMIRVTRR